MDIRFIYEGTVTVLVADTDAGREWIEDNIQYEDWQLLGGALVIQTKFAEAIMAGAADDGLDVAMAMGGEA